MTHELASGLAQVGTVPIGKHAPTQGWVGDAVSLVTRK